MVGKGGRTSGRPGVPRRARPAVRQDGAMSSTLPRRNPRLLDVDRLTAAIADGTVDTVIVAFTDMQGRLQGKRLHAEYFARGGAPARHRGLQLPARRGRRDEHRSRVCDLVLGGRVRRHAVRARHCRRSGCCRTCRARRMVQCDLAWLDGAPVEQSPRPVLQRQVDRAAEAGYVALAGTELEFIVFGDTYEQAWDAGYREPDPGQPVQRRLLDPGHHPGGAAAPGHPQHHACGRAWRSSRPRASATSGQHEIAFRYADALTTADNHAVYRNSAKEIAEAHGRSLTFMAKFNEREGNSCHIHLSLRGADGSLAFWDGFGEQNGAVRPRSSPACSRRCASSPCSTRRTSTPTSGSPPARSRRRPSRGAPTTAPARCGWSVTAPRRGWRTASPAGMSIPTWRWPAWSPAGCTASRSGSSCRRVRSERVRVSTGAHGAADAARGAGPVRRIRDRQVRVRRRRRRPLRARRRHRDRGVRRRHHRLGAAAWLRAAVAALVRATALPRAAEGCATMTGRLDGQDGGRSPAAAPGSGWPPRAGSPRRAHGWSSAIVDDARGPDVAAELGGRVPAHRRHVPDEVAALFATAQETYGSVDVAMNNAGISPAGRRLDPDHRAARLAAGCRRSI